MSFLDNKMSFNVRDLNDIIEGIEKKRKELLKHQLYSCGDEKTKKNLSFKTPSSTLLFLFV